MMTTDTNQPGGAEQPVAPGTLILLAGATGELGQQIAESLRAQGAAVRALVRTQTTNEAVLTRLKQLGVEIAPVDFANVDELTAACAGGTCVVSALSGLKDVIVETQMRLLQAAINANVPRFIPSDYCIDYTRLPKGENRNLDLRREFNERLDKAPIKATSILNGMFTDLLTGQAPVILFKLNRVVYWGDATQKMDFTTLADTARYTAFAALDTGTPRYLRIAGEVADSEGLRKAASATTGSTFKLFRAGSLGTFKTLINVTRKAFPANNDVFPAWQGMQYLHNMYTGLPKLQTLDNDRYPGLRWTSVRDVLATR